MVEHHVANVIVAGSNPVTRSNICLNRCECSSVGRASRCQRDCRRFESGHSLHFFLPKWAGKYGPCSSAASVTDVQVRSFSTSYRKTRISHAHFRQKVSVDWQSPGLAPRRLQSRTYSPLLRSLMSQNSNFPRPLSAKRVGWYGYGTGHGCVVEPLCATLTRGARP